MKKAIQICFVALVVVLLFVPGVFANREENRVLESEKRYAAEVPTAQIFTSEWRTQLENWLSDNLALREKFMDLRSALMYFGLRVVDADLVTIGKDGWLFYTGEDNLKIATGQYVLTEDKLKAIAKNQQAISDYYKGLGKSYILFLSPSRVSIYPEYLYGNYQITETPADIVERYLTENTDVIVVNAKDWMVENKNKGALVFEKDTHWTSLGAYYGYLGIADAINERKISEITPVDVDVVKGERQPDLVELIGCEKWIKETNDSIVFEHTSHEITSGEYYDKVMGSIGKEVQYPAIFANEHGNGMCIHIYGNSRFLPAFQVPQLLAEDFSKVVYTWTPKLSVNLDSCVDADIVVYVCGERFVNQNLDASQEVVQITLPELEIRKITEANGWNNGLYMGICNGEFIENNARNFAKAIDIDEKRCTLSGWAVDFANETNLSDIYIRAGEFVARGKYGRERSDISDYWGSEYKNCGFTFDFPASFLYDEKGELVSEVEVIMIGKDGTFMYEPIVYKFNECQKIDSIDLSEMKSVKFTEANGWNNGLYLEICNGEFITNSAQELTKVITVDNKRCTLSGWAVDFANEDNLLTIYVRVGENIAMGNYGSERTDISDYWDNENYRYCGFTFDFPADYLYDENGNLITKFEIIMVGKDGTFMYEPIVYELGGTE